MLSLYGVLAGAIGTGFISALFPPLNAEASVAIGASVASLSRGIVWVIGMAVGQTVGKVVVYEAARAGRKLRTWRRAKAAPKTPKPPNLWRRGYAWITQINQRLLALMDSRWRTGAVMLLSASVGLPPLLVTAVLAGLIKQHRLDFFLCVLVGRLIRFAVIATPFLALT